MRGVKIMIKKLIALGLVMIIGLGVFSGCGNNSGQFYTLETAYKNGWLSLENLQSIAYYYHGSDTENFDQIPISPENLSEEAKKRIKRTHLALIKKDYPFANINGVHITEYFGTYGECIAVCVMDDYRKIDVLEIPELEIGGVMFYNFTQPGLMIWRNC